MSGLAGFQVRRATLEDLAALTELWKSMLFDPDELTRRLTDFQVAIGPDGRLLGAVALQPQGKQGLIHSEGFVDFGYADSLRPLLWERIQNLAKNSGLVRVWTREEAPFWQQTQLEQASSDLLEKLPREWSRPGKWLTLKIQEDLDEVLASERAIAVYLKLQKTNAQKTMQTAKIVKGIVAVFGILVGLAILGAALSLLFKFRR